MSEINLRSKVWFILSCIIIMMLSIYIFYYIQYIDNNKGNANSASLIVLILLAGAFGGLLCSLQLKNRIIKFPHKQDHGIDLGVISDILFGIGGGFLVFLIIPEFPKVTESWGIVKLLSLSIVGGYSGRALINKVVNEQVMNKFANEQEVIKNEQKKMMSRVEEIQETENANEKACRMFTEIIEGSYYELEEIENLLKGVSQTVVIKGFELLNDRRRELALKLIGVSRLSDRNEFEEKLKSIKKQFKPLISLLEEIIKKEKSYGGLEDSASFLHYHYASLAYLYKDKIDPDWNQALKYINLAIDLYSKSHRRSKNDTPDIYLFNKLLCHINLFDEENAISCFDKMWQRSGGKYEIIRAEPVLAPKLHDWILNSRYRDEVKKYVKNNSSTCKGDLWNVECTCGM